VKPSRRSHLVHPLPLRTYDAEQSTRCLLLDKQCSSVIIISTTVICRLKYPNRRPRQLQFRVISVARGVLWSDGPDDHLRRGRQRPQRLVRPLTSRVTCVWWQVRRHQMTVVALIIAVPACDSPHRADGHGGLRQRCADGGRRSARIPTDWRGRLAPENSRTRTDADH